MRGLIFTAMAVALLALDWAAIHDILKGEPDTFGEYGMLAFSLIAFSAMAFIGLRRRKGQMSRNTA